MSGDPGWLHVPDYEGTDYYDAIVELQSYQAMACDVASYEDYYVEYD